MTSRLAVMAYFDILAEFECLALFCRQVRNNDQEGGFFDFCFERMEQLCFVCCTICKLSKQLFSVPYCSVVRSDDHDQQDGVERFLHLSARGRDVRAPTRLYLHAV